jgi:hypothetical protein
MARSEPTGEIRFISDLHLVQRKGEVWRVYADDSTYSEGSVQTVKVGKPEKDVNGQIIKFASPADADEWVRGGKIIYPSVLKAL